MMKELNTVLSIYYINEADQQVVVNYLNVKQQQTPSKLMLNTTI